MSVKIIDNFLKKDVYLNIKKTIDLNTFPWFLNVKVGWSVDIKDLKDKYNYQFTHVFFGNNAINSNYFNMLKPILDKLKVKALIRIKANLNPISHKLVKCDIHNDQSFDCKVAVYYLNDNNGYTMVGNKKVKSKANRMVIMNSKVKHYGTNSTDCTNRMVINFNYF
jgi:hypothetical protein